MSDREHRQKSFRNARETALLAAQLKSLKKEAEATHRTSTPSTPSHIEIITNHNPSEAQMADALHKISDLKKSVSSVAEDTGIGRHALRNAVKRVHECGSILSTPGRNSFWTTEMSEVNVAKMKSNDMRGNSALDLTIDTKKTTLDIGNLQPHLIEGTFANQVFTTRNEVMEKKLGRPLKPSEKVMCSNDTLRKIKKQEGVTLNANSSSSTQSERRYEALNDPYNCLSPACQVSALFPENYDQSLIFNYDSSSHFLNAFYKQKIVVANESIEALNEQHRNPTHTEDMSKNRSVSYGALTSARGVLEAFIVFVKDQCFNGKDPEAWEFAGKFYYSILIHYNISSS